MFVFHCLIYVMCTNCDNTIYISKERDFNISTDICKNIKDFIRIYADGSKDDGSAVF